MLKAVSEILKIKKSISNTSLICKLVKSRKVQGSQRRLSHSFLPEKVICIRNFSNLKNQTMDFSQEKAKYLYMSLDEKRTQYSVKSNYVTLNNIKTWSEYAQDVNLSDSSSTCSVKPQLNEKVSLFVGDITALEVDAIVNAANNTLRGGGGVDGAIHRAAGSSLLAECKTLHGCNTGEAKITGGYKLPAKYVIHTVGPVGEKKEALASCYRSSLNLALENNLRTIAFPCISTGVYGYPNEQAAHVAIGTVKEFLEQHESSFDRVIFCLFLPVDIKIYERLMQEYFPV